VEKRLDANFFQHRPFLDAFNAGKGTQLVTIVAVHIEPFGAYSRKVKTLDDLKPGATVAIPNDPSNSGRALLLLEHSGLLKLNANHGELPAVKDIAENTKKLKIRELEAAMLPRVLGQVNLALINTNYALEAKLDPSHDALVREDANSPYANFLVARPDNRDDAAIAKLAAALTTPEVKTFIQEKYKGAVVPAF
jgi:D-methionine transport system substrate-binding protein